jgi:hypothetical protein
LQIPHPCTNLISNGRILSLYVFFTGQGMYRVLDPEKTIGTLHTLSNRIEERFPQASLGCVCRELLSIARETHSRVQWAGSSLLLIRVAALFIVGIGIG